MFSQALSPFLITGLCWDSIQTPLAAADKAAVLPSWSASTSDADFGETTLDQVEGRLK